MRNADSVNFSLIDLMLPHLATSSYHYICLHIPSWSTEIAWAISQLSFSNSHKLWKVTPLVPHTTSLSAPLQLNTSLHSSGEHRPWTHSWPGPQVGVHVASTGAELFPGVGMRSLGASAWHPRSFVCDIEIRVRCE